MKKVDLYLKSCLIKLKKVDLYYIRTPGTHRKIFSKFYQIKLKSLKSDYVCSKTQFFFTVKYLLYWNCIHKIVGVILDIKKMIMY